jgi:hypothetical protein
MSLLKDLIHWVMGANGRTKEVKQAEEEEVQRIKDETRLNLDRSQSNFRQMKACSCEDVCEIPDDDPLV